MKKNIFLLIRYPTYTAAIVFDGSGVEKAKQKEFAESALLKRLAPERSRFKGWLKLILFLFWYRFFNSSLGES